MSSRKLLTEWLAFEYSPEKITESKEQNAGKILMSGILQKADTLNQNGRVYPGPILDREVRNYQKFIQENRALGELDHPDSSVVELRNLLRHGRDIGHASGQDPAESDRIWSHARNLFARRRQHTTGRRS